jgi:hypothetical protein
MNRMMFHIGMNEEDLINIVELGLNNLNYKAGFEKFFNIDDPVLFEQ